MRTAAVERVLVWMPAYGRCIEHTLTPAVNALLAAQKKHPEMIIDTKMIPRRFPLSLHTRAWQQVKRGDYDWLVLLEEDVLCRHETISKLFAYDLDCVSALYFSRNEPYSPMLATFGSTGRAEKVVDEYPENQLFQVDMTGLGCLLLSRRLIERIPDTVFSEYEYFLDTEPFWLAVKAARFRAYVDTGNIAGHLDANFREISEIDFFHAREREEKKWTT